MALEIAPAATKAVKRSDSIVFSFVVLQKTDQLDCVSGKIKA